jgi:hypothetical protein
MGLSVCPSVSHAYTVQHALAKPYVQSKGNKGNRPERKLEKRKEKRAALADICCYYGYKINAKPLQSPLYV